MLDLLPFVVTVVAAVVFSFLSGGYVLGRSSPVAIVYLLCRAMKVEELEMAKRALGDPLLRRFPAVAAKLGM